MSLPEFSKHIRVTPSFNNSNWDSSYTLTMVSSWVTFLNIKYYNKNMKLLWEKHRVLSGLSKTVLGSEKEGQRFTYVDLVQLHGWNATQTNIVIGEDKGWEWDGVGYHPRTVYSFLILYFPGLSYKQYQLLLMHCGFWMNGVRCCPTMRNASESWPSDVYYIEKMFFTCQF